MENFSSRAVKFLHMMEVRISQASLLILSKALSALSFPWSLLENPAPHGDQPLNLKLTDLLAAGAKFTGTADLKRPCTAAVSHMTISRPQTPL